MGDRSNIGADQCKSFVIFTQISLTPGQVATVVCQALEYSPRVPFILNNIRYINQYIVIERILAQNDHGISESKDKSEVV